MSRSRKRGLLLTSRDGCCMCILNSLTRGGWTIENMTKNRFHKPGVFEVWKKKERKS